MAADRLELCPGCKSLVIEKVLCKVCGLRVCVYCADYHDEIAMMAGEDGEEEHGS